MTEDAKKAMRGRPATGNAKTSAERGKASDEALIASGGRVLRARLSPAAAQALAVLSASLGSDKEGIDSALIFAAKNIQFIVGTNDK